MVFILSALWWIRIRSLWKLPDGRDWLGGKLGFVLMGRAMLSKSLIQLSIDGWGCVPSLLFDLRPNCGKGNEACGDLLQKVLCIHCCIQCPWPDPAAGHCWPCLWWRLLDTHRQVWVSLLWGHCSFLLGPGMQKVLFLPSKSLFPQSCGSTVIKSHWPPMSNSLGILSPFARSPCWEFCCGS